ncbi:putative membrane protein [Arcanobacterium wilhelmae]|uniref:Membrane protein n=1 Tax=Arcanobacterium wilhelmae TaxID=1803177 RepID=A0ABT9NBH6_9ACTO|nr:DUF2079 domain-containing protein [Arcanobacterium wilhelmae]MDP9801068.1 putative membrane protein [Arcanobacterium wilhelmae]
MFRSEFALLLALAQFLALTLISVWQWNNYVAPSWDLGIFTQLIEQYSHFAEPIVDIKGPGFNLWGDHFHPILLLLTPLYWVVPSGLTLLVTQNALFALSVIPVAWYVPIAVRRAGYARWIGWALPVSYALSWGIWNAAWSQFHEIAFAVPLLAFGLVAYLRGQSFAATALIGALVFVKEDLPLTVLAFALVAWWLARRAAKSASHPTTSGRVSRRRNASHSTKAAATTSWASALHRIDDRTLWLALAAWGLVWFVLEVVVILPAFNTGGQWDYASKVDRSVVEIAAGFFVPGTKLVTLVITAALGVLVCLRSPLVLVALPTFVWRFAGDTETYWGWQWHYSAVVMPIVVLAAADALERLTLRSLPVATRRRWVGVGVAASLVITAFVTWTGAPKLVKNRAYVGNPADSTVALATIPEGARVASDLRHLAYLVPGNIVYLDQTIGSNVPDYWIVSDKTSTEVRSEVAKRWPGTTWEVRNFGTVKVAVRR